VLSCRLLRNLPSVQRVSTPLCSMWRAYAAPLQRGTWNSIPVQFTCAWAVSLSFRLVSGDEALHHCVCLDAGFRNLWIAWRTWKSHILIFESANQEFHFLWSFLPQKVYMQ
jgi:hypothetical protein